MLHCHMLAHEDDGMMAQFAVVKPGTHRLPRHYYLAKASAPKAAVQEMSMTTASPAGDARLSRWRRAGGRIGGALLVEMVAIGLAVAVRRYWAIA